MDGLELSRRAKEENPALQIIIFSGYSDFAFAQEAIRYGVTEYILKPVNPDDFHKVIQKAEKEIERRKKKISCSSIFFRIICTLVKQKLWKKQKK